MNDIAERHGGDQNLVVEGITVPLQVRNGLFTIACRVPTKEELQNCTRIVLTSDQEWDVTAVSNETNVIVPTLLDEPDTFNGTFTNNCIQAHVSISNVEQADLLTLQARTFFGSRNTLNLK